MKIHQEIQQYGSIPLSHNVMKWILKGYRQPNDKIKNLVKQGMLLPVKKGLYVPGPMIRQQLPDPFLIANHLMGPSYVSFDSALSFYGMIPEKVFEISSASTKVSRTFRTKVGIFSYTKLPLPYYSFGITSMEVSKTQRFLIATREKALFDKIIATSGVEFRSKKSTLEYLEGDLRMDLSILKALNISIMEEWIPSSPKKSSLTVLLQTIKAL